MSTWHCPVCGLDFAFHSELDWHIREAHLLKRTAGLAGQLEREAVLSWALLRRLQLAEGRPSVSLLMPTTPAPAMTGVDAGNLEQLAARARKELHGELHASTLRHMEARLGEAVRAAEHSPTDHGLAVFVSATRTGVVPLPFSPRERAVVNHTFVTRDLLEALQKFPMYRVLVLRGPGFWLLEGRAERLSEVRDWQVPNPSLGRARRSAWTPRQRQRAAFAAADAAIGDRVALIGRLPLVALGRKGLLAKWRGRSPHAASVVGVVPVWGSMLSKDEVAEQAARLVSAYREQHTARYLAALATADRKGRVVWGLENVWEAVAAGSVERVWVESDYRTPGRLADGGRKLLPAEDTSLPGVTADVVDALIERAALAGAHVEMVDNLGKDASGRIAAQLGQPHQDDDLLLPAAAQAEPAANATPLLP